jgi:phospholipid transport system substrate-binding protein
MKFKSILLSVLLCASCGGKKAPAKAKAEPVKPVEAVATPVPAPTATPSATSESSQLAPEDTPTGVIQKYTNELKKIVEPKGEKKIVGTDEAREKKIAEKVRQFFDFEGLAKEALGRHWTRITPMQRAEYTTLFVNLIEDSYLRRTRDMVVDYKVEFVNEQITGNNAKVMSRVIRNDADVDIVYVLHRTPKGWMIFDIALDNVDLIRNYQTQFNRIIEQNGFNDLLNKMRKKRNEIEKNGD